MALAAKAVSITGLDLCRDPKDNCIVIGRKQAYEFFYSGKSSKDPTRMFPQFKPFRKLVHPENYRNHSESFITLQNFVDKFFSMAKSKRDLGKTLLKRLLVDLLKNLS